MDFDQPGDRQDLPTPSILVAEIKDLVSLPEIYWRVKEIVEDPDSSLPRLTDAVRIDPALSARILNMANSAAFGLAREVQSLHQAIGLLGMQQVHDLVFATTVIRSFAGIGQKLYDMRRFWTTSVHAGTLAKLLADRCHVLDSERLFLIGLLSQLGNLILATRVPEVASRCLTEASESGRFTTQAQCELLGFDYAAVSGALLLAWDLPPAIADPVRWHTDPANAPAQLPAALVHLGALLAEAHGRGLSIDQVLDFADPAALDLIAADRASLTAVQQEAEQSLAEAVALLGG